MSSSFLFSQQNSEPLSPGTFSDEGTPISMTESLQLVWNKSAATTSYFIEVEKANVIGVYSSIVKGKAIEVSADTTYLLANIKFKYYDKYRWRVSSRDDSGQRYFSKYFYFYFVDEEIENLKDELVNDEQPEEIFFSFKYLNLINTNIIAQYSKGDVFLPIREIFSYLMINHEFDDESKVLSGFFLTPGNDYFFDYASGLFGVGDKSLRLTENDYIERDNNYYISTHYLYKAFELDFKTDMSNLLVKLTSERVLPVYERFLKNKLLNYTGPYAEDEKVDVSFPRQKEIFSLGFLDYYLSSNFNANVKPLTTYQFGFGGELLGGEAEVTTRGNYQDKEISVTETNYKWKYDFEKTKLISQISLGDLFVNGLTPYYFRGIQVSNEPLEPRKRFSNFAIIDSTMPNYSIELYINENLIDITQSDSRGQFQFNLPVNFGTTLVLLKFYGPEGEFFSETRLYQIPYTFLPPMEFSYDLNFGKIQNQDKMFGSANVRMGLTEWLTNKVSVDLYETGNSSKPYFYNSLTARLFPGMILNVVAAPEVYYQATASLLYYSQVSLVMDYKKHQTNDFFNPGKIKEEVIASTLIPFGISDYQTNLLLTGNYTNLEEGQRYNLAAGLNASFNGFNPAITYNYFYSENLLSKSARHLLIPGLILSLNNIPGMFGVLEGNILNTRLIYDATKNQVESVMISVASNLIKRARLQLTYTKNFLNSISAFQLQFVADLPFLRTSTTAGTEMFAQSIQGSIIYNSAYSGLSFYNRGQLGRAVTDFRMFVDSNQNGVYDIGEEILKGVRLVLNNASIIRYCDDGIVTMFDQNPYSVYKVKLDLGNLKNPFLIPIEEEFSYVTDPNRAKLIDIPFYIAGEVSGNVSRIFNSKAQPLGGIRVIFVNVDTGEEKSVSTFSDGSYYYFGLKPGKYNAKLDEEQLRSIKLESEVKSVPFEIQMIDSGDFVNDINFELK